MRKKDTPKLRTLLISRLPCILMLALAVSAQTPSRADKSRGRWQRYELGKGSFSVLLPGKPVEEFRSVPPSLLGVSASTYVYGVTTEKGVYVAQYSLLGAAAEKWSDERREVHYNGVWNGMAAGFNSQMEQRKKADRAVLLEKRRTKFGGHDGYELTFTVGEVKGRALVTLVGRHGFAAMTLGTAVMPNADRERFFRSFIIKVSSAGPAARKTIFITSSRAFRIRVALI